MRDKNNRPIRRFLPGLLLVFSFLLFLLVQIKTSPYRTLRPYLPAFSAGVHNINRQKNDLTGRWMIFIPAHKSGTIADFWIDQIPVTMADYLKCVDQGSCAAPHHRGYFRRFIESPLYRLYPATYLSWQEARIYCRIAGGDLPTEAQWKAAAGIDHGNRYPWGNKEPNLALANYDGYYHGLTPTGWQPRGASPFGVLDMAGNVREWVLDAYEADGKPASDPDADRILKGGGASDYPAALQIDAFQWHSQNSAGFNRGFRCVYSIR